MSLKVTAYGTAHSGKQAPKTRVRLSGKTATLSNGLWVPFAGIPL